jgi:uncharacterized protein (TIGR01777 family)
MTVPPLDGVLILLLVQGAMGALDTIWHHELGGLPRRASARFEIGLHGLREAIYAVVFLTLGWVAWNGALAFLLAGLFLVEVGITLTDFVEEDRTRRLAPTERVLHTLMAIMFGAILAAFAPVLVGWARAPSGFAFVDHGLLAWAMTAFGLGVAGWAVRDTIAAFGPRPQAPPDVAASGRTVLITGATGFIGSTLVADRQGRGDRVIVLARDILAARARFPGALVVDDLGQVPAETRIDAVINLAGAATIGGLWTRTRKTKLLGSRLAVTDAVLALIGRLTHKPAVLLNASAVGFYGDRGDERLSEMSGPQRGRFLSDCCRLWEARAATAADAGVRVALMRFGMVFDWQGGPLPMLALPARFGMGVVMGAGRQRFPWIHLEDVVRAVDFVIAEPACAGPLNFTAPQDVTQGEFAHALAASLHRPQWMTVPAVLLRTGLGDFADLFLASQRAPPTRLSAMGFRFARPDLASALQSRARRWQAVASPVSTAAAPRRS